MLRLKGITKNYKVAGGEIKVLKGLDVCFRKSEFVSILGPSGCGKTTTLNIVGGLDKYTDGDLIIQGKSTKNFSDRDWDIYRNQRIGFVFQSYNLIPHQTVLGNVELALTISGVSKEERRSRSLKALERVGLKGEEGKRPNQLSGGQCQRVAIARALVNEPDILLADEPTGALDSKTSVQIMELIKDISKDKLVIMVTHNSEIADQYSTRIIKLVDGEIVHDSNPYSEQEEAKDLIEQIEKEKGKPKKKNKAKMSLWTAFKLSIRNLFSKRGRTILTSVAGSIGIIGISAVLAVSSGVRGYIASMQDDMLSGNPITVAEEGFNLNDMFSNLSFEQKKEVVKDGYVNVEEMMDFLAKQYASLESFSVKNNITQDYVDYVLQLPKEQATIKLDYGIDVTNNIYTNFSKDGSTEKTKRISLSSIKSIYSSLIKDTEFKEQASTISALGDTFMQAIPDEEYILSQYNLLDGELARGKNEIMIVVSKDTTLTDLLLAQLGYYTQDEFVNIIYKATGDARYDETQVKKDFSYSELRGKTFTLYDNDTVYNDKTGSFMAMINPFTYNYDSSTFSQDAPKLDLTITGILTPKSNISFGCLKSGFYYTQDLTEYIFEHNSESKIVKYFIDNEKDSITSGLFTQMSQTGSPYQISAGITYDYEYYPLDSDTTKTAKGYVGSINPMSGLLSMLPGQSGSSEMYELTLRDVAGNKVAQKISIYPMDFDMKDSVTKHLDAWNDEKTVIEVNGKQLAYTDRTEITYTDALSLIITMINSMIDIITYALIAFTSLALLVSCVMIAIITYVSVMERVKEIGVIRSLGGRKRDVSNLFNAETLIIGATSGVFGVLITYMLSAVVNLIVGSLAGITIMALPLSSALIMIGLSIGLTMLSGLIPAKKAAHQDPVVALRTE